MLCKVDISELKPGATLYMYPDYIPFSYTVKCRYNAVFGVQEIDRVIAVTAL